MDDMQLNISIPKKITKKSAPTQNNASEYKFVSKSGFVGRTVARKRPQRASEKQFSVSKNDGEPQKKTEKKHESSVTTKPLDLAKNLRDLSENKGKYHGKNYQDLNDELSVKQQPRSGGWISSLFKNNPDVPRVGQRAVKPIVEKVFAANTFSDLDIHPHCVANLQQNLNMKNLMTVQKNAVPVILQGRDVLIRSQTGSGKTIAYALPIVEGLQAIRPKINRHEGIRAVVVVPTRELAVQTYELFVKLVKPFTWVVPGLLSGGQKRKAEKARLRKGLSVLVGTPGRINDHLRHTQSLNFAKTNCLILDEADRLLDMGYEKDVAAIVKAIEDHKKAATYDPMAIMRQTIIKTIDNDEVKEAVAEDSPKEEKTEIKHHLTEVMLSNEMQTILLSATLTKAVESLAGITLVDPVFIDTSEGRALVADSLKPQHRDKPLVVDNIKEESNIKKEQSQEPIQTKSPVKIDSVEVKRGLKAFSGLNHPELFSNDGDQKNVESKKDDAKNTVEESDSDSDYEYFKVQKELDDKEAVVEPEEDLKTSEAGNTFHEAVKSAITEDELVLPASVNQKFLVVPMKLRLVTLCSLIIEHCVLNKRGGKMIVFMATLEMVDYHSDLIETVLTGKDVKIKKGNEKKEATGKKRKAKDNEESSDSDMEVDYEAPAEGGLVPVPVEMFKLHGSMPHDQRMEVFKQFRKAKNGLLICTVLVIQQQSPDSRTAYLCMRQLIDRLSEASSQAAVSHNTRRLAPIICIYYIYKAVGKLDRNRLIVTNDVAARGLDVPRVDLVLQYCVPASATDYVHRVGRTGRATQVGAAVMFLLPSEVEFVRYLEQKRIRLRQEDESKALEALRTVAPGAANVARAAIAVQTRLEHVAHSHRDWLARASRAYTSWVRFYSGYPREVRQWLDAKQLHLGHSAKAFALRDTPAALARRAKNEAGLKLDKPQNRLTVHEDEEKKRPGFSKMKLGLQKGRMVNKQSSMHSASEFDSGLAPLDHSNRKKKKKK